MTCSTCRYFKARDRGDWGSCRRYPPMGSDSMWPGVSAESWCGEYAAKLPEQLPSAEAAPVMGKAPDLEPTINESIDGAWYGAEFIPLPPVVVDLKATALPPKGKKA